MNENENKELKPPYINNFEKYSIDDAIKTPSKEAFKIIHISDTHRHHHKLTLPPGDILIHSGDFCKYTNNPDEFKKDYTEFISWFSKQDFAIKIFIAGNHDLTCDSKFSQFYCDPKSYLANDTPPSSKKGLIERLKRRSKKATPSLIYLENSGVTLNLEAYFPNRNECKGKKLYVYGAPQTPNQGMAFSCIDLQSIWKKIPSETDILITHQPPLAIMDLAFENRKRLNCDCDVCFDKHRECYFHWGCWYLNQFTLDSNNSVKVHCFGHVHDDNGLLKHKKTQRIFSNASNPNGYSKVNVIAVPWDSI